MAAVCGCALLAPALYASIQTAPSHSTDTAIVVGHVVDARSGAPVGGAVVELNISPASTGSGGNARSGATLTLNNVQLQGGLVIFSGQGSATRVLTGPDGRFAFRGLAAGHGDFIVTATGYSGGAYNQMRPDGPGQPFEIADGQHISEVTLKVWKNAAISGRVTDESGDPVVGAFVRVLRKSVGAGRWSLVGTPQARVTDDRGIYRASGLLPGDYLIDVPISKTTMPLQTLDAIGQAQQGDRGAAAGLRGALQGQARGMLANSGQQVGDLLLSAGRAQAAGANGLAPFITSDGVTAAYATTFYPSASTSARAMVITVDSGEERSGVDIQLSISRAFRVAGVLTDVDGTPAPNLAIHLVAADDQNNADASPDDVATTISGARGEFTLLAVPSGQYLLTALRSPAVAGRGGRGLGGPAGQVATEPTAWARQSVSVSDADLMGLAIALHPGISITGHVVFDGPSPQPTGAQLGRGIRLATVGPGLLAGPRGAGAGVVAQIATDGSFAMKGATPGTYQVLAPGWPVLKWAPKSVIANGRDVSDAPIDLEADLAGVVITFTDRPGALTGTVRRPTRDIDPSALVIGFPVDPTAPAGTGMHVFTVRADAVGTYTAPVLAPGEYNVVAIPDAFANDWQDPALFQRLVAAAVRVRITDGAKVTQDLTTSGVR